MMIMDKEAKKIIKGVYLPLAYTTLQAEIDNRSDNERKGRDDLQIAADDISYFLSFYYSPYLWGTELKKAQDYLKGLDGGASISDSTANRASAIVSSYRKLRRRLHKLNCMGYHGDCEAECRHNA